ncbi:hypothetical protein H4219_006476 [Mycoemilia scoparia]|uniref:Uncharacterized protein n=1 Tax=Mycoemilia scoparia TaxID=417184 RepID=A0A9W8DH62_9FUNG|nr:hypothetical protein H4219_006476 [Mycoemilia scoparia]
MPKAKTNPIKAAPPRKKPRTRTVARSEDNATTASGAESNTSGTDQHVKIPRKVDLVISKVCAERGGIEIHHDIPGYHSILTHNNVIMHGVMESYSERAHLWLLQCNKYKNPLRCLRAHRKGLKEVERPKLFSCSITTITKDNKLNVMRKWAGRIRPQNIFVLDRPEEIWHYECFMRGLIELACETLDHGDEYMMKMYR